LGYVKLINCSITGDILGNSHISLINRYEYEPTLSYNLNITIDGNYSSQIHKPEYLLQKNQNVQIIDDSIYFIFPNEKKYLIGTFKTEITDLQIIHEDNIVAIGSGAFYNCKNIENLCIRGVGYTGNNIFNREELKAVNVEIPLILIHYLYGNKDLKNVIITNECGYKTGIWNGEFADCKSLTNIILPEGVLSIGGSAFGDCSSLISISIPESVTSIGEVAFSNCSSLTSITIPNSVTSIGRMAFSNCSSLTSITIPEGLTSIEECVFEYCNKLKSIDIPEGVTSIGDSSIRDCSSLTSITIPNSVTSIGRMAFSSCSSLTSITIPEGLTSIEEYAFYVCGSLTSIIYQGTRSQWVDITKGSGWNVYTGDYTIYCTDGTINK
ncbi:MAG: leucine-rich repeat domain-containing protein, partial [Clostridia bacterium]|nr:leucine-rich repeat domain-containing protein [Clostridia bacterium]